MRNQTLGRCLKERFLGCCFLLSILALWGGRAFAECAIPVNVIGSDGTIELTAEVMQSPEARAQGLMFRTELAPDRGMLFVYPSPRPTAFWMKNTYISLDIMFFDRDGHLLANYRNTTPQDVTPLFGGDQVMFVLETTTGLEARFALGKVEKIIFDEGLARECGS